jgi:outer membrane protein OmpU
MKTINKGEIMNNFKKIGLTALAGSLMTLTVSAGEMSVSGTAEITYTTKGGGAPGVPTITGDPFGMKNDIAFTGSGDVNGNAVTYTTNMTDGGASTVSTAVTMDMGAIGAFSFEQGMGSHGVDTSDDSILPTAYEEPSHGGGTASLGITGSSNAFGYKNSFMGLNLNLEYNPDKSGIDNADGATGGAKLAAASDKGHSLNYVLSYSPSDGLTVGAGRAVTDGQASSAGSVDAREDIAYIKYVTGPISVGYFINEQQDNTVGANGLSTDGYSIAFAVNDNLSISYAERELEQDDGGAGTKTVESNQGIMASYTMGGASLRVAHNEHDNVANVVGTNTESTEISLVLAF